MSQNYAIIDPSNTILSIAVYAVDDVPPNPHPTFPDCTFVPCSTIVGSNRDGWTYVNGEFIAPPIVPMEPIITPTPTMAELQAQMAQLQAHMMALMAQSSS